MLKIYNPRVISLLLALCLLVISNATARPFGLKGVGFLDKDQTSMLVNTSAPPLVSNPMNQFSPLSFDLQDIGGDGFPTSLTRLVFEVQENGIGLADTDGSRLADILQEVVVKNTLDNTGLISLAVDYPTYNQIALHFDADILSTADGETTNFELLVRFSDAAQFADHSLFSLQALTSGFEVASNSSLLDAGNASFTGTEITFNVESTAFRIEGEPALVISDGESGEEFSIFIKAVDGHGRHDVDFVDDLTIELMNTADGRVLYGDNYPSMLSGEATSSNLMYGSNNLPENFQLVVSGNGVGSSVNSKEIYAVAAQDENSEVAVVAASGTSNIDYVLFQETETITSTNSARLAQFTFSDSPGSTISDGHKTYLERMDLALTNPANLHTIALFEGTTKLAEQLVTLEADGILQFDALGIAIDNKSDRTLDVRATFKSAVTDNEKISVGVYQVMAGETGSQFKYQNPGEPISIDNAIMRGMMKTVWK